MQKEEIFGRGDVYDLCIHEHWCGAVVPTEAGGGGIFDKAGLRAHFPSPHSLS